MDFLEVPRLPANCRDKLVENKDGQDSLNLFGLGLLEQQTGSEQQVLNISRFVLFPNPRNDVL